jgi:hypothetical protein
MKRGGIEEGERDRKRGGRGRRKDRGRSRGAPNAAS